MSNIRRIPLTEMVERLQGELLRDQAANTSSEKKYKGVLNDVYTVDLPLLLPDDFIRKTTSFTTKADYSTGTITTTAGGSSVTGASTSWTSANSNDALLKASSTETVYRVAYSSGTSLTLSAPSTWVDSVVTADTYRLMFDRYSLVSDFASIVEDDRQEPEAVYYYTGSGRAQLDPKDNGEYERDFSFNYSTPGDYTIKWVNGSPYIYLHPCDDSTRQIFYEYIPHLLPMVEFTDGTITVVKDATAVAGASTLFGDFIDTTANTYYLRADGHGTGQASEWYQVDSVASDTDLTLSSAMLAAADASSKYTISMVSKYPAKYDTAILYTAAYIMEPNHRDAERWKTIAGSIIPGWNSFYGRRIQGHKGAQDLSKYV